MKRIIKTGIALLIALTLCVVAFAEIVYPPFSVIENGNVVLKIFKLSNQTQEVKDIWAEMMTGNRTIVTATDTVYRFVLVPENYGVSIVQDSEPNTFKVLATGEDLSKNPLTCISFTRKGNYFEMREVSSIVAFNSKYVVGGSFFNGFSFPTLDYQYVLNYPGTLSIVDDLGGSEGNGGILDWLSSFWDKLLDFFKSIFIPSSDYFKNFFNEIKTAFESKLGGIGDLMHSLSDMFERLKNTTSESSLVIHVPDNQFFPGYKGISVNVLEHVKPLINFVRGVFNSIIIVFTIIICYRKIVSIIKT